MPWICPNHGLIPPEQIWLLTPDSPHGEETHLDCGEPADLTTEETRMSALDPQPLPSTLLDDELPDDDPSISYINCGCGFNASSNDPSLISEMLTEHARHNCPNAPQPAPERWWDGVFSLPTVLIALIVAVAVVQIVGTR